MIHSLNSPAACELECFIKIFTLNEVDILSELKAESASSTFRCEFEMFLPVPEPSARPSLMAPSSRIRSRGFQYVFIRYKDSLILDISALAFLKSRRESSRLSCAPEDNDQTSE
jgi:hypothetical protein